MARPQSDNANLVFEQWTAELGLRKGFRIGAELLLSPEASRAANLYKRMVRKMGLARAFRSALEALLYTGPRGQVNTTINRQLKNPLVVASRKNHTKAIFFADAYGCSLLERTPVGKAIDDYQRVAVGGKTQSFSLFDVLLKEAKKHARSPSNVWAMGQQQFDIVMGFVSAAFIFSCKGNVDTLVCGASPQKVFYLFELPVLMANEKITSINNVPKEKFLKVYNSGREDAAYQTYRMICESEIDRLGVLARQKGRQSKEWEIWQEQKQLHHVDLKQHDMIQVCKNILSQKEGKSHPTMPTGFGCTRCKRTLSR